MAFVIDLISIAEWRFSRPAAFFFCAADTMKYIQRTAVILNFRSSQVKGQHHLVFRYAQVERLFDRLRLHLKAA
ncbi:MAG: hypothetical protein V4592_13945 [Bacteroidota bacterium]